MLVRTEIKIITFSSIRNCIDEEFRFQHSKYNWIQISTSLRNSIMMGISMKSKFKKLKKILIWDGILTLKRNNYFLIN